ncbi:MAG: membrane protein insertion efficiency factor YidD [bacterium]
MFKFLVLKTIGFYQIFISPLLGKHCRFYPSCSQYMYEAVQKYGLFKGLAKGIKRISKCHHFNPGGVDLP